MSNSVSISDLSLSFGAVNVLKNLDLEVRDGEFLVLLGSSGCGKSTLLNCIAGLLEPTDGQIFIKDRNVTWEEPKDRGIGMVFQSYALYPQMTVEKNLSFGLRVAKVPEDKIREKVARAAEILQIEPLLKRKPAELSGGQRKRVFLARALAQEGQVILLDEPFTGVDVTTEEQIIALMRDLRAEGRVMLVSTHNLGSVPDFCDRTIFVKGTVIASGPTEDTFTEENLKTAFGGALRHFVLGGADLHDDADARQLKVITDDERPFVIYGKPQTEEAPEDANDKPSA